jgi:HK97 gp10 family phage protein
MPVKFPLAFKIVGLDRVRDALANAPHTIRVVANRVADEEIPKIVTRARELAPVRTGRLRNSIYWRKTGFLGYTVGARVFYAGFVEFGTRFMRARPYLRPAIEEKLPEIREELKDALVGALLEEMR